MSSFRRHIPYLPYHKSIIREICTPQKDDLLIMAKGLGMRRIICALLKTYDRKEDLVLVVNASPSDEAGIGDELGIMGVRDPGFRVLTYEMNTQQREDLYRMGGLFSVTSKILVHDFLKGTVPAKLVTGLVILHAEKVSRGSQEEFCVRLYRRDNQSGFCKSFSDEPEAFAHGMAPMKDMLVNLNMNNVMIWPRYNEAVKVSLATRKAEVVELYQPLTPLMRQIQDAITECMEAMLVELKRDHSLNLDLDDINVRNAQFKNFDTKVRMLLQPVWHKVGAKTRILVAALTDLRNLHTWLLEYDSATFASYILSLQRQHFEAEKLPSGYGGRFQHYWFNAKSAATLVEASQGRVSQKKAIMDNQPEHADQPNDGWDSQNRDKRSDASAARREFEDDEAALRDAEMGEGDEDDDIMEIIATQTQPATRTEGVAEYEAADEEMREVGQDDPAASDLAQGAPPIFRPVHFDLAENLESSVKKRLRANHEPVLEELPKWSLLAKVLKEIEDTIARTKESHADEPGTNIVLVMVASDRTALQLRQYLTTMDTATKPAFGPRAGRAMMNGLFLSNWQLEENGRRRRDPARMHDIHGGDEVVARGEMEKKRRDEALIRDGRPYYKRRRLRGGMQPQGPPRAGADASSKAKALNDMSAFSGSEIEELDAYTAAAFKEIETTGRLGPDDDRFPGNGNRLSESTPNAAASSSSPRRPVVLNPAEASQSLMAEASIIEEEDLNRLTQAGKGTTSLDDAATAAWMEERGLFPEDFDTDFGLLDPEDTVIIRPYGGEDDDILLTELRPRFVVCYEPNLSFIRRLEVYKNSHPGLALRVYQMVYANSFEEDRFLTSMQREDDAFKKLIDDRSSMVIPIYNNNPRAPMRDQVSRAKTTYSSRNAGGSGDVAEQPRVIVDIRELGALLPSLLDDFGIKIVPATLTVGDYIISPDMCVERKSLPDLEGSFANGRLHTQCESMTSHYKTCILLIEFEEGRFGLRTKEDSRRESIGRNKPKEENWDAFLLQSKLVLLTLHFPNLRIIWSSSPTESVQILAELKKNHDEPDELSAILKGSSSAAAIAGGMTLRPEMENTAPVEMLRTIPGVQSHSLKYVLSQAEGIKGLCALSEKELCRILGAEQGKKAHWFIHFDGREGRGYDVEGRYSEGGGGSDQDKNRQP